MQQNQMTLASSLPLGVPAFKPIPVISQPEVYSQLMSSVNDGGSKKPLYSNFQNQGAPIRRISDDAETEIAKNTIQSMISPYAHVRIHSTL